jgi:DNA-binding Xre family transcriptional regulator
MIKQIDPHRISLALGVLFILGLGATAYSIYSLQAAGTASVWFFFVATSLIGSLSLVIALLNKKEIIVFKEKVARTDASDSGAGSYADISKIDLTEIKQLAQRGGKDVLLNGLKAICRQLEAGQGAIYSFKEADEKRWIELSGGYALSIGENTVIKFDLGEGLIGQSAAEGKILYIDEVPEGYMKVVSGLGMASPRYLLIVPAKKEDKVVGVLEVSTFKAISATQRKFVEEAAQLLGAKA